MYIINYCISLLDLPTEPQSASFLGLVIVIVILAIMVVVMASVMVVLVCLWKCRGVCKGKFGSKINKGPCNYYAATSEISTSYVI